MEFWRYYRVLRRRRWLVAVTMLTAIVVAFALNRPAPGDWTASATLSLPSVSQFAVVSGLPAVEQINAGQDRSLLAIGLIRSRDVAERAIQQFNLSMRPEELQRRLSVEKDPVTNLIRVRVSGRSPAEAVALANAVAGTAAGYDQEVQRRGSTLAREFIEKQATTVQNNLRAAEDALLAYQQQNGMALAASGNTQVAALQSALDQVRVSLQEADARLASDRAQMSGQAATRIDPQLQDNPIAQQLRAQLVQLEVQLTAEQAVHTDKYPTVIALKAKIDAIKERLKSEVGRIVGLETVTNNPIYDALLKDRINLETERVALQARQEALQGALTTAGRNLPDYVQKQMERERLARDVDILGKQYANIQGELATARLREQETQVLGSLTIADLARGAYPSPFAGLVFRLTLALVLGLMAGLTLAFFLEYLDNALGTPEAAERLLGIPTLVAVPRNKVPFVEAYRRLRMNLTTLESPNEVPVLAATGARPSGGTSTVVANLARAFALAGRRTIVVDTDFRRPTQHRHFDIPNETGLLNVLAGGASLGEAIVSTDVRNLSVLPSGHVPDETGDLLCSKHMADLLADLKQRGDVILIDTPPAGAFPDILAIAPQTTGVMLVLDASQAPRGVEQQVKLQLKRVGANVLGSVLTKVRPERVDAYVYQERYYKTRARRRLSPATGIAMGLFVLALAAGMLTGGLLGGHAAGPVSAPAVAPRIGKTAEPAVKLHAMYRLEDTVAQWAGVVSGWVTDRKPSAPK